MTERAPYPSQVAEKVLLRLPDGMRDRLAEAAKVNSRSMNAEIVIRLEESLALTGETLTPRAAELADKIVQRVVERMDAMRLEMDKRQEKLEAENRALREAANSQSPEP